MASTDYDYIIIGSGIAGLNVALLAQEHGSVLILTKGKIDDCNTRYAQGGIAVAVGPGDSSRLHMQDTLAAGVGLCDLDAVAVLTQNGPERVANLIRWGVAFDTIHGEIALGREGAHSVPRVLHAGGDATGQHIELTLAQRVAESNITVMEYTLGTELLMDGEGVQAVETLDCLTGQRQTFSGRFIVIATGGAGQMFRYTTNPEVATGDGAALAFRVGAPVMDMEFYQFHPTAFRKDGAPPFLLSEAMRGEGAVLRNEDGRAFMGDYHPLGDLAPRDVVSRAMVAEMEQSGTKQVYLDISHLPPDTVQGRFPNIYNFCQSHGVDITKQAAPVAPAAHYMMGGVKTDTWGRTGVQGLYACGEVACAAVHGANRLASNSLLDTVVFAHRLVDGTLGRAPDAAEEPEEANLPARLKPRQSVCASIPPLSVTELQDLMWRNAGMDRNGDRLLLSARILNAWERIAPEPNDLASYQLRNMVLLGRMIVEAALLRQESRGSHFRRDFPDTLASWERHIVLSR